jgi:hypothetical protein
MPMPYSNDPEAKVEGKTQTATDPKQPTVFDWRLDQLQRAGYSRDYAAPLAIDDRIDLHEACDLLRLGCPQRTAFRILT